MAKITAASRDLFNRKIIPYKELAQKVIEKEKNILTLAEKDTTGVGYKKLLLAEDMIYLTTIYLIVNNLSVEILDTKNEDALNDGRKMLYKAVIYLEEITTNFIDVSFSEYEAKLSEISNIPPEKRYYLIRKLGLAIRLIEDAYGENTKWKWSFVELEARFATVTKNIIDMQLAAKAVFDPRSPDHDIIVYHLRLVKKLLAQAADRYRDKYELSTKRIDDFRLGINYLLALRRIHIILNERDEAEDIKKKVLVWKEKMDKDHKSIEAVKNPIRK